MSGVKGEGFKHLRLDVKCVRELNQSICDWMRRIRIRIDSQTGAIHVNGHEGLHLTFDNPSGDCNNSHDSRLRAIMVGAGIVLSIKISTRLVGRQRASSRRSVSDRGQIELVSFIVDGIPLAFL
jgi:hypothetical protein